MTVSTQAATVVTYPYSGDYRIDVLLEDSSYRWNNSGPLQSSVTVTYSFMAAAPTYAEAEDQLGFTPFTDAQQTATRQILTQIAQNFNIAFTEVTEAADSVSGYGQIRFGNNHQGSTSAGYAFLPDAATGDQAGDLYINNQDLDNLSNVVPGSIAYATLVHEIGHTLGLKHPGNYNAGEAAATAAGNYLVNTEDTTANTIMSYVDVTQMQQRDFFGRYDILALQYLYGGRAVSTGNSTYAYADSAGQTLHIINDSDGADTIDVSACTLPASIDLGDGASSSIGRLDHRSAASGNLSLAYGATIENVIGSSLADTIVGNAANNTLKGGGGNDTIDGGTGLDTVLYAGTMGSFTIQQTTAGYTVRDDSAAEGSDSWVSVERAQFSDKKLAFDMTGNAGNAAKIIAAALGPEFLTPAHDAIKGAVIAIFDGGTTLQQLAASIVSLEPFVQMAGSNSNMDFVKFIYKNVTGGSASAEQADSLVSYMQDNKITQGDFLATVADLHLNVDLAGLARTGMEYV
ncbi:MAG: M10 family metallopeptidase C-terminal domain-containing protein [Sterolibacterium sp.]|jgi:hypothetical protein